MSTLLDPDPEFERRVSALLLEVLIRAGLVLALAMICFQVFSPFLSLMAWALILAVTLYPLHQSVAATIGGRQGLAATLIVLLGIVVVVVPTAALMNSLGDSVHRLINDVQNNTLQVPPPREGVAEWPLVGEQVHAFWTKAHTDLPALVQSMQPKIGNLAAAALGFVAGIGGGLLQFLASLAVAGIMMAFGEGGARAIRSIFERVADGKRGAEFVDLSTATIRAVAKGVLGVAFLQAIIVGICLLIAGIPWAGVLAVIVLVLGIAQVPALIVTLPAIAYLWCERQLRHRRCHPLHGPPCRLRHGRQRAEAVDARPRRGCADAGHPSRRARRYGRGGHPGYVRRRHASRARLPDLHGMGRDESRGASSPSARRSLPGRLNRCTKCLRGFRGGSLDVQRPEPVRSPDALVQQVAAPVHVGALQVATRHDTLQRPSRRGLRRRAQQRELSCPQSLAVPAASTSLPETERTKHEACCKREQPGQSNRRKLARRLRQRTRASGRLR